MQKHVQLQLHLKHPDDQHLEQLLKLKDLMNTETAIVMAEKRHRFLEEFLDQFYEEWEQ